MPRYELALILSCLERSKLHQVLKRTAENIMKREGIIESWEKFGEKQLPYRMRKSGVTHTHGNYFFINFSSPHKMLEDLNDEFRRDVDVIKQNILKQDEHFDRPCNYGPCIWGEIPNPNYEKVIGKLKSFRKY